MNIPDGERLRLEPWSVLTPDRVVIPGEASLVPMSMLYDRLFGTESKVDIPPGDPMMVEAIERIGAMEGGIVNLRDASDIISPAAALMAMEGGGTIAGARHARGKESDRIGRTVGMLADFGMTSRAADDGIEIPGGQVPTRPKRPVETHSDHRLAMTAMILAGKVGGEIVNPEICAVTDPGFIERLMATGGGDA
tara:strand:+ start:58 stop:639 length:582 start_codon:yes stop_codon:yes gene_type:complete